MKIWLLSGMAAGMISCMPQAQVGAPNGASGLSDVSINFKKDSAGYKAVEGAVKKEDPKGIMGYSLKIDLTEKSSEECKKKYPKNNVLNKVVEITNQEASLKIVEKVKSGCSYSIVMGLGKYGKTSLAQIYVSNEKAPTVLEAKGAAVTANVKLVPTETGRDAGIATDQRVESVDNLETEVSLDVDIDLDESVEAKRPEVTPSTDTPSTELPTTGG